LFYDPERSPNPALEVGKRYPAERDQTKARGNWLLQLGNGETISAHSRDLCNQRDKLESKLAELAHHVIYEAAMLLHAFDDRSRRTSYTAWFVHYRNLILFFRGKGHDEDEGCAQDFFADPLTWHEKRRAVPLPSDPVLLSDFEQAANELAVHLSYNRSEFVDPAKPPNAELTAYVRRLVWSFLDSVPPDRRAWFSSAAMSQLLGQKPAV